MKRKSKTDLASEVSELTQRLDATLAELSVLRKSLIEVQQRRDDYYFSALELRRENDLLQAQLVTARQNLAEARHAVETVNERLRTATACRCQVIEVTAGDWRLFQTIDCPVHPQRVECLP